MANAPQPTSCIDFDIEGDAGPTRSLRLDPTLRHAGGLGLQDRSSRLLRVLRIDRRARDNTRRPTIKRLRLPLAVSRLAAPRAATIEQHKLGCLLDPYLRGRASDRTRHRKCLLESVRVVAVQSLAWAFAAIAEDAPSAVVLDAERW